MKSTEVFWKIVFALMALSLMAASLTAAIRLLGGPSVLNISAVCLVSLAVSAFWAGIGLVTGSTRSTFNDRR